jgi:hypothetical protein
MNLFIVLLRRPKQSSDFRDDPFWEFGSFGSTGCHSRNLLHPKNTKIVDGDRLAFVQGGSEGMRIVAVTPPVTVGGSNARIEICWDESFRPLAYQDALSAVDNAGNSSVPLLFANISKINRSTYCGKFSSAYRSRSTAVTDKIAKEIIRAFDAVKALPTSNYVEAIASKNDPWVIEKIKDRAHERKARSERYRAIKNRNIN